MTLTLGLTLPYLNSTLTCIRIICERKKDRKLCTLTQFTSYCYLAAVENYNLFSNRKSQTASFRTLFGVRPPVIRISKSNVRGAR